MKMLKLTTAIATVSLMTGCASIVGEKEQSVTINSSPSNADVLITDERSMEVHSGTTPSTVQLRKSDGSYFGGKSYTVEISKEGYESRTMMISSSPNEAVEKPDFEPFPPPVVLIHLPSRSSGWVILISAFSHLSAQLKLVEDDLLLLKSNLPRSKPFMTRPCGHNSLTSQYCAPGSKAATGPVLSSCPAD